MFSKQFFEFYAQILLTVVVNKKYGVLACSESPDFISRNDKSIGVEVTCAISSDAGNFASYMNQVARTGKTKEELVELATKRKLKPWIYQRDGVTAFAAKQSLKSIPCLKQTTALAINRKLKKLNRHYQVCAENELFLFSNWNYNQGDIEEIINLINFSKYKIAFSTVYFLYGDILHTYVHEAKTIETREISRDVLGKIKQEANELDVKINQHKLKATKLSK